MAEDKGYYDDLVNSLSEWGVMPQRQALLQQQMAMAQKLRGTPLPEGRQVGRVFVASNPLETAGAALGQFLGQRQIGQTMAQQGGLVDREQALRGPYLQELQRRYQEEADLRRQILGRLRGQDQSYRPGTYDVPGPEDVG